MAHGVALSIKPSLVDSPFVSSSFGGVHSTPNWVVEAADSVVEAAPDSVFQVLRTSKYSYGWLFRFSIVAREFRCQLMTFGREKKPIWLIKAAFQITSDSTSRSSKRPGTTASLSAKCKWPVCWRNQPFFLVMPLAALADELPVAKWQRSLFLYFKYDYYARGICSPKQMRSENGELPTPTNLWISRPPLEKE